MARVAGLRVGLRDDCTGEEVDDRALARPGPADDRDVQRLGRLAFEERPDHVARQRGREPERAGVRRQFRLPAAVVFEPAKIVGQLADGGPVIGGFHAVSFEFQAGVSSSTTPGRHQSRAGDPTNGTRLFPLMSVGGRRRRLRATRTSACR